MVDNFALLLTHVLLALAAWRLFLRNDLDEDPAPDPEEAGVEEAAVKRADLRKANLREIGDA